MKAVMMMIIIESAYECLWPGQMRNQTEMVVVATIKN